MLDFLKSHSPEPALAKTVNFSKFNKVMNFCLYALVLLTPVLFASLTSDVRDFNKQSFVFLGVAVMLGVWVVKILTTRSVSWVKTSLDYILLVYLGVYLLTSLMSIDKISSFLGYYGRFTGSFVSTLILALFYFLLVNNLKQEHTVKRLTNFLLAGIGVTLIYSVLQLFGVYILPMAWTHDPGFNPIGSLVGLGVFAALSVVFMQWYLLLGSGHGKLKKAVLWILTIAALVILFLINAFVAWLVLALALVAFIALAMSVSEHTSMWRSMLILVIAVLFVAFQFLPSSINPRNLVSINLPIEVQLSNSATWHLVANSMKGGAKAAILGSGPGTTGIAFGNIKPTELNKTVVWSLNFDRASTEIAGIAIETGILGLVVFELLSLLFLGYGLYFLMKKTQHPGWVYGLGFFILWLALYITHFFYFFNATFYFLYWLSLGVFMAVVHMSGSQEEESSSLSMSSSPRAALSWMFVSLLMLAAILIGVFFEATVYGGEIAYAKAVRQSNVQKPDWTQVSNQLGRAISLNPYRDVYYLAYGRSLILVAQTEVAKPKPDNNLIQNLMASLISAGQQAVSISPGKASNWQALAQFYADIKPLASNADQYIISSLKSALDHDMNNPALHYQLGQAYFAAATVADQSKQPDAEGKQPTKTDPAMLKAAESELNRAIELKSDLPEFYIQLSRVLETDNQLDAAKKKMDEAADLFGNNPDILFEDGRVTYNQKNYDEAKKFFNAVITLSPDYANAHYSLGLIAQQQGDKPTALAEFNKVRDLIVAAKGDTKAIDQAIAAVK